MRTNEELEEFASKVRKAIALTCKKCHGIDIACSCRIKCNLLIAAHEACIPKDFQRIKEKDIKHNRVTFDEVVLNYLAQLKTVLNNGYGILFTGDNGVGKTFFMSYILMEVIKKGRTTYYTTMPQLDYDFKRSWKSAELEKRLNMMFTSDFVAIDELGKERSEKDNSFTVNNIERIMKQRCDDNLPMLLASNRSFKELKNIYGSTFGSLLTGKFQIAHMDSGDYRKTLAQKMRENMGQN